MQAAQLHTFGLGLQTILEADEALASEEEAAEEQPPSQVTQPGLWCAMHTGPTPVNSTCQLSHAAFVQATQTASPAQEALAEELSTALDQALHTASRGEAFLYEAEGSEESQAATAPVSEASLSLESPEEDDASSQVKHTSCCDADLPVPAVCCTCS